MHTYISLFRGINVGGNNLLPMKSLLKLCEDLGITQAKTYIQSGNLIYQHTEDLTDKLQTNIHKDWGFKPQILTLNLAEYRDILNANPYQSIVPQQVHCYFCFPHIELTNISIELAKITKLKTDNEEYLVTEKAFYLFAPDGIGRSKLAANIEKILGVNTTSRNLNSLNKILNLAESM